VKGSRRIVSQSVLERWADELVMIRREVIAGVEPDLDRLRYVTSEIRLAAGGYPVPEPFKEDR
jgi:hypothetical protein